MCSSEAVSGLRKTSLHLHSCFLPLCSAVTGLHTCVSISHTHTHFIFFYFCLFQSHHIYPSSFSWSHLCCHVYCLCLECFHLLLFLSVLPPHCAVLWDIIRDDSLGVFCPVASTFAVTALPITLYILTLIDCHVESCIKGTGEENKIRFFMGSPVAQEISWVIY